MGQKKQVVFIHGGTAFSRRADFLDYLRTTPIDDPLSEPPRRWKNTLADDLGPDYEVYMPSMPNKQNAKYEEWKIWFERHLPFLRDGVILIGHSQGGYFLVKYLCENTMPVRVKALILIAAPFGADALGREDGGDFAFDPAALPHLEEQVEKIVIFHSPGDTVVPFSHAEKYKTALPSAELIALEERGHFLDEAFPELLEQLRSM